MFHQKATFLTGFRSIKHGTVQNLNSKGLRILILVGWWVLRHKETLTSASLLPMLWRPFGAYFVKNTTFMQRDFNDWDSGERLYMDWSLKPVKCLKFTGSS